MSADLLACGLKPFMARKAVCLPLARDVEVGFVPADGWVGYDLCRRQLSWQAASRFAGQTLVISAKALKGRTPTAIITQGPRRFRPPRLPDRKEMLALIARPSYLNARPDAWEDLSAEDPAMQEKWLRVMGLTGVSFAELFISHKANHANFIEPAYYLEQGGRKTPYSISKTKGVCSACLELFGIVGNSHGSKLVVPCPGAVIFAGLLPNRYYLVESPDQGY